MSQARTYCPNCRELLEQREVEDRLRDYCTNCDRIFYDNPLPVVSAVVLDEKRQVLMVLRGREPEAGKWCLPSGFVELDESIEEAVLRELREETGIQGKVLRLVDSQSYYNETYGDLIWVTFEVKHISGEPKAGDDAVDFGYYPLSELPELAFPTNERALHRIQDLYSDIWAMHDSYIRLEAEEISNRQGLLSDSLFGIINEHADDITSNWVTEVNHHPTTLSYGKRSNAEIYKRGRKVLRKFANWITHPHEDQKDVWEYFRKLGRKLGESGYDLAEVVSALSLIRKHVFAHVLKEWETWDEPLRIYTSMEFMTRVNLFFDRANYQVTKGYESPFDRTNKAGDSAPEK